MTQVPEDYHVLSMILSEVTDEIGINEKTILARRHTYLQQESMNNIIDGLQDDNSSTFIFGSMSEGSTTVGLHSDIDFLKSINDINIIQDFSEWKPGVVNYLIIQDDTIPPGYCFLQVLRQDAPLPLPYIGLLPEEHAIDIRGRILLKNTSIHRQTFNINSAHGPQTECQSGYNDGCLTQRIQIDLPTEGTRNGPSLRTCTEGFVDKDIVIAYQCRAWPMQAMHWMYQQTIGGWPSEYMKMYAISTGSFVVPVGSRNCHNEVCQWRISTSLAERCLMFNLNMTQLRTFILMKMILKQYINPYFENALTSFICKTALFYCIRSTPLCLWRENMLLLCLRTCMMCLYNFVSCRNCPHFMIPENNLLRGKVSRRVKHKLRNTLLHLIHSNGQLLLGIDIDDLGTRLQSKFNALQGIRQFLPLHTAECDSTSGYLVITVANSVSYALFFLLRDMSNESSHEAEQRLFQYIRYLSVTYNGSSRFEKKSCSLLLPFLCTTLGSVLASSSLGASNNILPHALQWFSLGLRSDVASSRLKLASVLYCSGEFERAKNILADVEQLYDVSVVEPVCKCFNELKSYFKINFFLQSNTFARQDEAVRHLTAFCVKFFPCERNCIPAELQYEITRSDLEDLPYRGPYDSWMEMAVVDSLPYLHFLLYKTYSHLGRQEKQQEALVKLARCIEYEGNLAHRETSLNLLGQCYEENSQPELALTCYAQSLNVRERHNAARLHINRVLSSDR